MMSGVTKYDQLASYAIGAIVTDPIRIQPHAHVSKVSMNLLGKFRSLLSTLTLANPESALNMKSLIDFILFLNF